MAIVLALSFLAPNNAHATGIIDYDLNLQLHPDQHRISGSAQLTSGNEPLPAALRLNGQASVSSVEVDGRQVPFTFQGGQLKWENPAAGTARSIRIVYQTAFNDPLPPDTVGVEDPSFGVYATILPEGTFLAERIAWFPQSMVQRGRHRVRISAPAGVLAVTAGRLLEQKTTAAGSACEWQNDFPLDGLALAAGRYQISSSLLDDIQLLTFLLPDNAHLADAYQEAMRRQLAFYRELLGPYPFAKFAVVENFLPTGYGLPSWTLLGSSVVRLPFILDTSLPHEIVHSWWGNAVDIDFNHGNWGEGLATYLADYLLKEHDQTQEALEYRRKILRDYASLVTAQNDFPLRAFGGRRAKYQQAIGYGKGAMVFHMLRRQIGDQAFREGLRSMAAEGTGGSLGWPDLERIFNRVSRQELRWFFRQWVEQGGGPQLALEEVTVKRRGKGWTVQGVVVQSEPAYRLDLPLRLTDATGGIVEQNLALKERRTPFLIGSQWPPALLVADPESHLFRRLTSEELPATVNDLRTPRRPLVVVATGQESLLPAARDLLKGLHWQQAEVVSEATLDPATVTGRDLLLLGWPLRPLLQPVLPSELTVAKAGQARWQVAGAPPGSDVLFAVVTDDRQGRRTLALLLAETPEAARQVAAKISHYGRYSLLLFTHGRNIFKQTWESASSPLRIVLPKEPPL